MAQFIINLSIVNSLFPVWRHYKSHLPHDMCYRSMIVSVMTVYTRRSHEVTRKQFLNDGCAWETQFMWMACHIGFRDSWEATVVRCLTMSAECLLVVHSLESGISHLRTDYNIWKNTICVNKENFINRNLVIYTLLLVKTVNKFYY